MPPQTPPPQPPSLPSAQAQPSTSGDMLEPDEQLIDIVRRHPIGIVALYLGVFTALIVIIVFFALITPDLFDSLSKESYRFLLGGIILALAVLILFLFVSTYVYRQSRLLITDRSLVQVVQKSLFIRKISRLNFANVEDVSAEQRGILATIFNYGTLVIQTAGALDNFIFPLCPNPNKYADEIIEARQRYADSLKEIPEPH
ncbi:PH domain-containing protein [Candidatus Saccharibacteria bacterium]|nr:PH domain-containing protein [Candidatus Saccharibacteria bacterium]